MNARISTARRQQTRLSSLRAELSLEAAPLGWSDVVAQVARQVDLLLVATIEQEVAAHHPLQRSRHELLLQACGSLLPEMLHLVDPDRPAPRSTAVLFGRVGSAEARAGRDLDSTLAALDALLALWSRAASQAPLSEGGRSLLRRTLLAHVAEALSTAILSHSETLELVHDEALQDRTPARSTDLPPRVCPEVRMKHLVRLWATDGSFDVTVRPRRASDKHALAGLDHVVTLGPHPTLGPPVTAGAQCLAVPQTEMLATYHRLVLTLRLAQTGLVPMPGRTGEAAPAPFARCLSSSAAARAAAGLRPLRAQDPATRTAWATTLQHFIQCGTVESTAARVGLPVGIVFEHLSHLSQLGLGAWGPTPLGSDCEDLLPPASSLATLTVLQCALPLWRGAEAVVPRPRSAIR